MRSLLLLLSLPLSAQSTQPAAAVPAAATPAVAAVSDQAAREAIDRGVAFLVAEQNKDGSWGGARNKMMTDSFANAATYDAWIAATTGLCAVALLELGRDDAAKTACDRALDYLCRNADVKRPADWDTDNTWGLVYGLLGVSKGLAHPRYKDSEREPELRKAGETLLAGLKKYQSDKGGWAYYADPRSAWLTGRETSFTTAVGVLALCDARDAGLPVDSQVVARATAAVEHCRLPNGAFSYAIQTIPEIRSLEGIDNVKGSLGRIQVCNLALLRAGGKVSPEQIRWGLERFFADHKFLDVGRMKPIPHEAYYQVAGYFYFFGHYYTAQLLDQLPPAERERYVPLLRHHITKTIEADGSMWDFYIASHTRAYGTAFGILTLGLTLPRS
jgi:hypothetical protein